MHFEYWQNKSGKWNFRIVNDGNHKILASSNQGYENEQDCIDTMTAIHASAQQRLSITKPLTKHRGKS